MTERRARRSADSLALFAWLSPSFPTGAFAYSHGLEAAVAAGDVHDAATLTGWIEDLLRHGAIRTDLILASCAARALGAGDAKGFADVAALALSLSPSRERHLESTQQGGSFLRMLRAAWPSPRLDLAGATGAAQPGAAGFPEEIAYPVAFGAAVAAHGLALRPALAAFALQFVQNLVSAVVRLGVIGQTEGQMAVASFAAPAQAIAAKATRAGLDQIGGAVFRSDIASLRHEVQYSRLFRS